MQVPKFKVFHPEGFSTMVLFLIVDVSFGSFQLDPPDAKVPYPDCQVKERSVINLAFIPFDDRTLD